MVTTNGTDDTATAKPLVLCLGVFTGILSPVQKISSIIAPSTPAATRVICMIRYISDILSLMESIISDTAQEYPYSYCRYDRTVLQGNVSQEYAYAGAGDEAGYIPLEKSEKHRSYYHCKPL